MYIRRKREYIFVIHYLLFWAKKRHSTINVRSKKKERKNETHSQNLKPKNTTQKAKLTKFYTQNENKHEHVSVL